MFEKFLADNAGDFRQRYEGTYGYYTDKKKGTKLLTLLSMVDLNSSPRRVHFEDCQGVKFYINADAEEDIGWSFLPPKSNFYNTKRGVFYVQRVAARQFQRGVTSRNTKIWQVTAEGFSEKKVGFSTLLPIYEEQTSTIGQAKKWQNKEEDVMALSPNFCLYNGRVTINVEPVGTYNEGRTEITLNGTGNLFLPELTQALHQCGLYSIGVVSKDD